MSAIKNINVDGTTYSIEGSVSDIQINGTSVVSDKVANVDLTPYATIKKEVETTDYTNNWSKKTWNNFPGTLSPSGTNIWLDYNNNMYWTCENAGYAIDEATSTWSEDSEASFITNGEDVWTDGDNIYYSGYNGIFNAHYILNKSTNKWQSTTFIGTPDYFYGEFVWTDGNNVYYSFDTDQYVLDKSTSTWSTKTWTGLTNFRGSYVWTDGNNVYYSYNTDQYVLDKSTSTWSTKTWTGLTSFYGYDVWTDGTNIYYSWYWKNTNYVLNKNTSTWSKKTWTGSFTDMNGEDIVTNGSNVYAIKGSLNFSLDHATVNVDVLYDNTLNTPYSSTNKIATMQDITDAIGSVMEAGY